MLVSAHSIGIHKEVYKNNNGVLLAPIINLGGLILRADEVIPQSILTFLESHGAEVRRVVANKSSNDTFVRLTGKFSISALEIQKFIKQHKLLMAQQKKQCEYIIRRSCKLDIQCQYDHINKNLGKEEHYFDGTSELISVSREMADAKGMLKCNINDAFSLHGGIITSQKNTIIRARDINLLGALLHFRGKLIKAGIMAHVVSLDRLIMEGTRKIHIDNSVVSSVGPMQLYSAKETGSFRLTLEKQRQWVDNPYAKEFQPFYSAKKLVTRVAFNSELDKKLTLKSNFTI